MPDNLKNTTAGQHYCPAVVFLRYGKFGGRQICFMALKISE